MELAGYSQCCMKSCRGRSLHVPILSSPPGKAAKRPAKPPPPSQPHAATCEALIGLQVVPCGAGHARARSSPVRSIPQSAAASRSTPRLSNVAINRSLDYRDTLRC